MVTRPRWFQRLAARALTWLAGADRGRRLTWPELLELERQATRRPAEAFATMDDNADELTALERLDVARVILANERRGNGGAQDVRYALEQLETAIALLERGAQL